MNFKVLRRKACNCECVMNYVVAFCLMAHFLLVGGIEVTPSAHSTNIISLYYSNISGNQVATVHNASEIPFLDKSNFVLQRHYINTSAYENRFLLNSTIGYELELKSHTLPTESANRKRRGSEEVTRGNMTLDKTPWTEVMRNDQFASVIWDVTDRHAGLKTTPESVEKCLNEFKNKTEVIAAYSVSITVRENRRFLSDFIHQISEYSHLHDLRAVKNFHEKFQDILEDHRLYHSALKNLIINMSQEVKFMITCNRGRSCSCFSSLDVARYEQQFSSLPLYDFLLKTYLVFGYYIDPVFRTILTAIGLILNCIILVTFIKHKGLRSKDHFMVLNITVNATLILILYVPLQYIHTYYSSILPHEESSPNAFFVCVQTLLISANAMSLLILTARHYTNPGISSLKLPIAWQNVFCGLAVWLVALAVTAFTYAFKNYPVIGHVFAPLVYFVECTLILPIAMNIFKRKAENVPALPEENTLITTSTINELSKTFKATHLPLIIWLLLEGLFGFILKLARINYTYVEIVFHYVYFSYACANTRALCRGSFEFRRLMSRNLITCWHRRNEQQNVAMDEIRHPDLIIQ